jgi:competence protein ComFC
VLHLQGVKGPWTAGIGLDWHTTGSQLIGEDESGQLIFETQRSEIGELLYQLRYRNDQTALANCPPDVVESLKKKIKLKTRIGEASQVSLGF